MTQPHAVIVGSGPNGLTAAALLARAGWQVDVHEGSDTPGGAARSAELLGAGTISDLGAAAHPFGVASPVFRELGLAGHGLRWASSRYAMAHPLDGGRAAFLSPGVDAVAEGLGPDGPAWRRLHGELTRNIDAHLENLLGPLLRIPPRPVPMARFAPVAALPARALSTAAFRTPEARALFTGSAVHSVTAPGRPLTAGFGLLFGALGMSRGWPVAVGGTGAITTALLRVITEHGGRIHLGERVDDLDRFRGADAIILNLTPAGVLRLRNVELPGRVRAGMRAWRHGPGCHKIDLLLDGPVPWSNPAVAEATTVHVCGDATEIQRAETEVAAGRMPERPFVIVCQQQIADPSRAREGGTVVWAYGHVPAGFVDKRAGELILRQIERFAPGFRDRIRRSVHHSAADLEAWNPNLVGGDVGGGSSGGLQAVLRLPARLRPGLYLASASTAPGGGVHGVPGARAAQRVLADHRIGLLHD